MDAYQPIGNVSDNRNAVEPDNAPEAEGATIATVSRPSLIVAASGGSATTVRLYAPGAYRPNGLNPIPYPDTSNSGASGSNNSPSPARAYPYQPLAVAQLGSTPTKTSATQPAYTPTKYGLGPSLPTGMTLLLNAPTAGYPADAPGLSPVNSALSSGTPSPTKSNGPTPTGRPMPASAAARMLSNNPLHPISNLPIPNTCARRASTDGIPSPTSSLLQQSLMVYHPPPPSSTTAPPTPSPFLRTPESPPPAELTALLAPAARDDVRTVGLPIPVAVRRPPPLPILATVVPVAPATSMATHIIPPLQPAPAVPAPPTFDMEPRTAAVAAVALAPPGTLPLLGQAPQPQSLAAADETLQGQAELLHELAGGKFDLALCEDVLAQVGGDVERAARLILDEYGGGGGTDEGAGAGAFNDAAADLPDGLTGLDSMTAALLYADLNGGGVGVGVGAQQDDDDDDDETAAGFHTPPQLPPQGAELPEPSDASWWQAVDGLGSAGPGGNGAGGSGGSGGAAVTWDDGAGADPWATTDAYCAGDFFADGIVGGGGDGAGAEAGAEAQGIFAPEQPAGLPNAAAPALLSHTSSTLGTPHGARSPQAASGVFEDGWVPMDSEVDEEALEDKVEELRIYFPHLEDCMLMESLKVFNGDVQPTLQMLGELLEEEAYRDIEVTRQAESDAALARELEQQHGASPGVNPASLLLCADSAAEDYVLNTVEHLGPELSHLADQELRSRGRPGSAGVASLESQRASWDRWALKVLVQLYGDDTEEDLLARVLSTHEGNVDAARAALSNMGFPEKKKPAQPPPPSLRPPLPTPAPTHPQHQQQQQQPPFPQEPRFATPPVPADYGWSAALAADGGAAAGGSGSPLVSRRCPSDRAPMEDRPSGLPPCSSASSLPAVLVAGGGSGGGPSRRSASACVPAAAGGGELSSYFAAPARSSATATALRPGPNTSATAALARAAAAAIAGSGSAGTAGQAGPIRLLASIGVNFLEDDYSDEALQCVRTAFNNSPLRELMQPNGGSSMQELMERQRGGGSGRAGGGGLNHEEKQALWAKHRELPLALKAMKELLQRGANASYQSGSKRLARELQDAAKALEAAIREQHRQASDRIYADINAALRQQWQTDLHGMLPHEALAKLDDQLAKLCIMGGLVDWVIITGKGLHSRGDGPKLPSIVDDWLARQELSRVLQPGSVLVRLTPEVFERLGAQRQL